MYIEIISPETTLYKGDVVSLVVPGSQGHFELLNQHASIVSELSSGFIRLRGNFDLDTPFEKNERGETVLDITSGIVEVQNNKITLLVD